MILGQWMTAGRGIVHSEMPAGGGRNNGLQLWINLARKDKMYGFLFSHAVRFIHTTVSLAPCF